MRPFAINTADDPARIPHAGAFPLQSLAPGHYVLRVIVTDQTTMATATQQVNFTVD